MSALMRFSILLSAMLLSNALFAQLSLDRPYSFPAGKYEAKWLVDSLDNRGVAISYAEHNLQTKPIYLNGQAIPLGDLLREIFGPQAQFTVKAHKVVVQQRRSTQHYILHAYLEDGQSKERIPGAFIQHLRTGQNTVSNSFGYFSLAVDQADSNQILIKSIGFEDRLIRLVPAKVPSTIALQSSSQLLASVEVVARPKSIQLDYMSHQDISPIKLRQIPAFLGETDVLKTVQTLPGVQGGLEAGSGLYIRGGSPDQNLLLLDGVPVYNANHLFGFFSVFNGDAVKHINLIKGGFPARYGGRLSAVLQVDMKEGDMREYHGSGALGIVASRLMVEGPIVKDKLSFMVSGRRTFWDLLLRPFSNVGFNYYFGDANAKVNWVINPKNRLYLSSYFGGDFFRVDGEAVDAGNSLAKINWGNRTFALRWNALLGPSTFSNTTLTYSRYQFNTRVNSLTLPDPISVNYRSGIEDYGLRYDLEHTLNPKHKLRTGVHFIHHRIIPGFGLQAQDVSDLLVQPSYGANDLSTYVEDEWQLNARWSFNLGLHHALFLLPEVNYNYLQPRLAARYMLLSNWSLKASYSQMAQFIHLVSSPATSLPTDVWVSSTKNIAPQEANQWAIGSYHEFDEGKWSASVEAYYKQLDKLITYKNGANLFNSRDWENALEQNGKGTCRGLEFYLKREKGPTTGWLSYTLSKAERQFANINNGETYPFRYDRRHLFTLVFNHQFSERFDIGLQWIYASGQAFSLPTTRYYVRDPNNGEISLVTDYSERNAYRYPDYHRLDVGFNFHSETSWGKSTWNISIYNLYNRKNPFYLDLATNSNGRTEMTQWSLFPIIPSLSYVFQF